MDYHKQKEKVTFKVVPHTSSEIFSLRISKRIIKFLAIFFLISLLTLVGALHYYYKQYKVLSPYEKKNQQLKEKNKHLKEKLTKLSTEAKEIKQEFEKIKRENQKIKQMVDFETEIKEKISQRTPRKKENQLRQVSQAVTNPQSASNRSNSEELIKQTKANLNLLKEKIPEKDKDLSKLEKDVNEYKNYLASCPRGWPVKDGEGRIVSTFGYRIHPILKKRMFHDGVDIGVWYRHKVVATGAGKVVFAGQKSGYGNVVIVDHGFNYRTLYAHNNRLLVDVGDRVVRGEPIALSGNTGRSTGPHVHYEVQYNRDTVDPMKFINY